MVGKQSPSFSSSSSSFRSMTGSAMLLGTEDQLGFRLTPFTASPSFSSSEEEDDVSSPFMSGLSDNLKEKRKWQKKTKKNTKISIL